MSYSSNSGKPRLLFFVILALLAGGGYWYYTTQNDKNDSEKPAAAAQQQMPPAEVVTYVVEPTDVPVTYEYSGRTAGSREVEIRARVSGILMKRAYIEGAAVKEGDLLFEIDSAPFNATLAQTKARFVQAANDWKRAQQLYKQKALSAREYDEAQAAYAQLKAEIDTANINLGYTKVTAPISGVTSKEGLSEGSLITADSSLLTRLTQLDPLYVNFAAPDAENMKQRQDLANGSLSLPEDGTLKAEIRFGDGTVYQEEGTINFTDSIIDEQTGTISTRAIVPNPNNALLPGQFVRVVVKGFVRKNTMAIPDKAIMQGPQGTFVYVVNAEGKAAIKPVKPGDLSDDLRIINEGLEQGDVVIVQNMIKVRPDAPVKIVDPNATEAVENGAEQAEPQAEGEANSEEATASDENATLVPQDAEQEATAEETVAEDSTETPAALPEGISTEHTDPSAESSDQKAE